MIYLDNAATTCPDPEAVARAEKFLTDCYYNPSARYGGGHEAYTAVSSAREGLIRLIADPLEYSLVFTSCGTEADNQAVFSCAKGTVIASAGEHAAVYQSVSELKNRGYDVKFAPLRRDGSVDGEALLSMVDKKTSLVCVMHVNNETGAVNDIVSLAREVKKRNPRCRFFSDGVQAFGKLPFRLSKEIDYYSVSAHKIGGIKGVGALYKRKNVPLSPYLHGGGQEGGLRSGTENVFGIMCFSYAAENRYASCAEDYTRVHALREELYERLAKTKFLRISSQEGSPYILTVAVEGARGEVLQRMLWDRGVAVGTGSACSSKKPFSRVIEACGYPKSVLGGVLRLSFSVQTTEEEIIKSSAALNAVAAEWKV